MQTYTRSSSGSFLSEEYIQDAFHSYLKSSLTQARIEKLLDTDVLSSAEGDLMITGPALCLYFAALRCTTNPPSVPLPRRRKNSNGTSTASTPTDLSTENCPPAFRSFLSVWARCVPPIQALTPEHQHDLARIICGLDPLTVTISEDVYGIAADLRAVAIEISQRRSFQDRYASDLQAALDGGGVPSISSSNPSPSFKASFVPPPSYEDVQHNSPSPSPTSSAYSSAQSSPNAQVINLPPQGQLPPQDATHLSPFSPTFAPPPPPPSSGPDSGSGSGSVGGGGGRTTTSSPSRPHSVRVSVASTASSATLYNDTSPSSPPFPVPQIPIGSHGSHGTYYPPHIPPPGPNADSLPPPLPAKSDRPSSSAPGYVDEEGGYGQGQGYYKTTTTNTNTNTTKPLKLQKHRKNLSSISSINSTHSATSATSRTSRTSVSSSSIPTTPTILTDSSPIDIIRETLYAALADVLSTHASLRALLKLDPPRAYFGSVALAILDVAWGSVRVSSPSSSPSSSSSSSSSVQKTKTEGEGSGGGGREHEQEEEVTVIGVLGTSLTLTSCPTDLKPFMIELGGIAKEVRKMREEDDERVIRALQEGREPPNTLPRYERVRAVLEEGVGGRSDLESGVDRGGKGQGGGGGAGAGRSRSPSGRAVAFANRINALALGMTRLKAFRERQGEVFRVLAAASASGGSDG